MVPGSIQAVKTIFSCQETVKYQNLNLYTEMDIYYSLVLKLPFPGWDRKTGIQRSRLAGRKLLECRLD